MRRSIVAYRRQLSKARGSRRRGRMAEALRIIEQLLEGSTPSSEALVLAAECMQVAGDSLDLDKIESLLRDAVLADPNNAEAALELGHFLLAWRDAGLSEAEGLLADVKERARAVDDRIASLECLLCFERGDRSTGLKLVRSALRRNPESAFLQNMKKNLMSLPAGPTRTKHGGHGRR